MVRNLSIVSMVDGMGKTAIGLALGLVSKEKGLDTGYMKPLGTRLRSRFGKPLDEDPILANEILELEADPQDLTPIVYSQTFIEQAIKGREKPELLRKQVLDSYEKLSRNRELMLIEGGGKLSTGGVVEMTDFHLAELFDAEVVLLSTYENPGDLDDLLAAADRVDDNLLGVIFNAVSDINFDEVESMVAPFLENKGIPVLGVLPRKKSLAGISIDELAEEIGARKVTDVSGEEFIERFLVGAMTGESALRYLRRTKDAAVITGGDRSDIQRAALESPGVKCLILTGGFEPPGAVIGKAEEKGVPILLVQSDTLTTIEAAENVIRRGRTRGEKSVKIMKEMLIENADIEGLLKTKGKDLENEEK